MNRNQKPARPVCLQKRKNSNSSNVKNPENMLTRHIHANIGHQNISSCFDCIFKQVDEYDGTIFCAENGLRVISDVQGYGNDEPCEKLITRGGLVYESR